MHHKKGLNVYVFLKHYTVSDTVVKLEDIIIKNITTTNIIKIECNETKTELNFKFKIKSKLIENAPTDNEKALMPLMRSWVRRQPKKN